MKINTNGKNLTAFAKVGFGAIFWVAASLYSASAFAADAGFYNWSGFYVGGYAGYGWGKSVATDVGDAGGVPFLVLGGKFPNHPDGFIGGAQAGFNIQSGIWVWGLEADYGYFGLKDTEVFHAGAQDTFLRTDASYDATFRARLGFTNGPSLFYVTGGAILADMRTDIPSFGGNVSNKTDAQWGWTLGAGIEYALTQNWSVKGEYLYYDLGSKTVMLVANPFPIESTGNIVRIGLNYRFGN